jgi:hypothetical protein
MRRTMVNYEFIKDRCADDGPYEATQLINSFLGALAHPWQRLAESDNLDLRKLSLDDARRRGWPVFERERPCDFQPRSYFEMLTWTRHAFAHGNLDFWSAEGNIVELRFWNMRGRDRIWGTRVSVTTLERFLYVFQDLANGRLPRCDQEQAVIPT